METNGENLASSQTGESSLEIVVLPELIDQLPAASFAVESKSDHNFIRSTRAFDNYLFLLYVLLIYLGASVVCFYLVRHQISGSKTNGVLDAFYLTFVLLTSVGYGDLIPDTTLSLLLATLFAILGMLLIGGMCGLVAESVVGALEAPVCDEEDERDHICLKKSLRLSQVCYLVVHFAVGIPVMVCIEDLDFVHAFYCINATLISVGSDNCFSTKGGRVFALIWIYNGMFIITWVLFMFTESYTHRRQTSLVKLTLERKMTPEDMEAADLDGDGNLLLAEYILYMLNEMEKLRRQDVEPIIEEYQRLDVNTVGLLASDGAHRTTMESDGGNQASSSEPPRPSYKTIPISSLNRKRKFSEYFPWLQTSDDLWKLISILFTYLGAGTTCFYLVRHHISGTKTNNIIDAIFFTLVILTSVGYGDLSPDGTLALLLSSLFSLLGMFLLTLVVTMGTYALVKQPLGKFWRKKPTATLQKRKESNKVRNKIIVIAILFLVHMAIGTAILVSIEDLDFIHAFYCICVTITSAGSHKCFSTKHGRVLALFWIVLGTIYKGYVVFTFTELYTQISQRSLMGKTVTTTTRKDLEAADLDGDGVVMPAEYILHKLKEKGKLDEEDVAPIIEKYQRLYDVDNTGRVPLRDKMS